MTESSKEEHIRFSPELLDERINASLELLYAQISALTEMMDRLIQSNLITESTTASSQGPGLQHASLYSEGPGSSKFPTVAPLTTVGYSPDSRFDKQLQINWLEEVAAVCEWRNGTVNTFDWMYSGRMFGLHLLVVAEKALEKLHEKPLHVCIYVTQEVQTLQMDYITPENGLHGRHWAWRTTKRCSAKSGQNFKDVYQTVVKMAGQAGLPLGKSDSSACRQLPTKGNH